VQLVGGAEAHIVVAPTASPRRPGAREDRMAALLRRMGVKDVYVLEPRHPSEVRAEHVAAVDRATGVWFGGGRQWRTVDAFEGTPVVAAFHRVLQRGGVVAGSSAGATIQGELLVRGNPLGNTDMWCEGYDRGFGFLPGCAVDQHFVARQRLQDLQALITALPQAIGIGVDEGTCALVMGPTLEVLGRRGAVTQRRWSTWKPRSRSSASAVPNHHAWIGAVAQSSASVIGVKSRRKPSSSQDHSVASS
jgi:cyanophycinase